MRNLIFVFSLVVLTVAACSKDELKIDENNLLVGTWTYSYSSLNGSVYSRSKEFVQAQGYKFSPDGSLVERNIAGWCGTPPVSYSDYEGDWSFLTGNQILINRASYDGTRSYKLQIDLVTKDSLKVSMVE
jgi:hypothetical protein